MSLEHARAVADAVLYEGYLLYPYRASSSKNQSRWQWGVLGPAGAAAASLGEEPTMSTQCLVRVAANGRLTVQLRFLQLQARLVERVSPTAPSGFESVDELSVGSRTLTTWDEATPHEVELGPYPLATSLDGPATLAPVRVDGGEDVELLLDEGDAVVGRVVRRRWPLDAQVRMTTALATPAGDIARLEITVENVTDLGGLAEGVGDKQAATRGSFIGAHLLLEVAGGADFVSLLEPPDEALEAAAACQQSRCWPVLAGTPGQTDVVLASPIILYDYPEVAEQSAGALFDSTEIDEILTLRVMTLTDEEKAAARATDPRAAEIIDRCDQLTPQDMQALHGILRDPRADVDMSDVPTFTDVVPSAPLRDLRDAEEATFDTGGSPWWDPAEDASVSPETDGVFIEGVLVAKDSLVRIRPSRRADAQDIFFADQTARVTAVLSDVDGQVHVAVVLVDDPAADMHEWYGRYLYFGPEELEPLDETSTHATSDHREESRS